jgi:hypothetical protein
MLYILEVSNHANTRTARQRPNNQTYNNTIHTQPHHDCYFSIRCTYIHLQIADRTTPRTHTSVRLICHQLAPCSCQHIVNALGSASFSILPHYHGTLSPHTHTLGTRSVEAFNEVPHRRPANTLKHTLTLPLFLVMRSCALVAESWGRRKKATPPLSSPRALQQASKMRVLLCLIWSCLELCERACCHARMPAASTSTSFLHLKVAEFFFFLSYNLIHTQFFLAVCCCVLAFCLFALFNLASRSPASCGRWPNARVALPQPRRTFEV